MNENEFNVSRWHINGDHPEDNCETFDVGDGPFQGEGKVVRRYRHPDVGGLTECPQCGKIMHVHGWIDAPEKGRVVCPGDWIITGIDGQKYPCKNDLFIALFER